MQELAKHFFRIIFFTIIFISFLACEDIAYSDRELLWELESEEVVQFIQHRAGINTEDKERDNESIIISSRETSEDFPVPFISIPEDFTLLPDETPEDSPVLFVKTPEDSTLLPDETPKDSITPPKTVPLKTKPLRFQPKGSAQAFADSNRFKQGSQIQIQIPKDLAPSNPPLSKATSPLDSEAYREALREYEQENYKKAFSLLEPLAYEGHAEAQYLLGRIYFYGDERPGPISYREAFYWFALATNQNHIAGRTYLGLMYVTGLSWTAKVPRDIPRGMQLYKESAAQGWIEAQLYLGRLHYYNSKGYYPQLQKYHSYHKAFDWFLKAAQTKIDKQDKYQKYQVKKQAEGKYMVGFMYYYGRGVEKDLVKAREWLVKSADEGNELAKSMLLKKFS